MRKPLSEREQSAIKEKLLENCRICWERYGYKKTGVAEVAAMAGISTGAFYAFFPSKEMLFAETANAFSRRLFNILTEGKPDNPSREDFAAAVKLCADELFDNKWVFSLRDDAEKILRKLPADYMDGDFKSDLLDVTIVVKAYGLVPKVPMEEIVAVLHTLLMSIYLTDIIGTAHKQALFLLTDSAIGNLFE
ncbi:MAG: TetR/AcrR family transcriptional regulator [Lactobacillales bacterium]|jgi:AcrR family transcriptional regulator|nr:TetR/AcrR family transcriptional regulator [Lactobacillales bacterium]